MFILCLTVNEQTLTTAGTDWRRALTSTSPWSLWALSYLLLVSKDASVCSVQERFQSSTHLSKFLFPPTSLHYFLVIITLYKSVGYPVIPLFPQPRTPRCQAAVRASTVWLLRAMAARWEATAAPCLEEEEVVVGGGIASSPTGTRS